MQSIPFLLGLASCDRRNDAYFITIIEGSIGSIKKADIFAVDIKINKATEVAFFITNAGFDAWATSFEGINNSLNGITSTFDSSLIVGQLLEWRGN